MTNVLFFQFIDLFEDFLVIKFKCTQLPLAAVVKLPSAALKNNLLPGVDVSGLLFSFITKQSVVAHWRESGQDF